MRQAHWKGRWKMRRRFNWRRFRFEWVWFRDCYRTNVLGETTHWWREWDWESKP